MPAGRLLDANQALARACVRAALCHDRDIPARVT